MGRISVGQILWDRQLRWSKSEVAEDGACVEVDGVGFPPQDIRDQILRERGEWELVITAGNRTRIMAILRESLGKSMNEVAECTKCIPAPVYRGTKIEANWLLEKMKKVGVEGVVRVKGETA
jgi:hypothetical protein